MIAANLLFWFFDSIKIVGGVLLVLLLIAIWTSNVFTRDRAPIIVSVVACFFSIAFIANGVSFIYDDVLQPHHRSRIESLIGLAHNPDADYNVDQSKMTISSGGLTGKGYLKGTLTQWDHVPEQSTDFIFCTIGEEWGFIGSAFLLIIYLVLLLRIVNLAERQRSKFSRLYAYGVAALFFIQISINIGMTIGLVPVVGIPLPFISYGGSSVLAFSIMIFIMLRLDADRLLVLR
jgi:rod shape determining protein RodA